MAKRQTKSPIKNLPVRLPGQSIRDRIIELLLDRFLFHFTAVVLLSVCAIELWVQYFTNRLVTPIIFTVLAVGAIVVALLKIPPAFREIKQLKLGLQGEKAVAQFLEEILRPNGYQVLHDIPGEGFNIDHVVIGLTGIYTIETKTHSKPLKGECNVNYDGEKITVNGFTPERDPIVQANAQSRWLHDLVKQSTGKDFKVQPVVLYPGWFVKASVQWPKVWVQNEKMLPSTLSRQKPFIDGADVHLVTYHLKRYIIAKTEEQNAA